MSGIIRQPLHECLVDMKNAPPVGDYDGLGTVGGTELFADVGDVVFDG